jgi:sugar phosphate permease
MQSRTAPYSPQRAYTIWIAGLIAYIVAVVHRTSLGVTGLEAASHFGTTASQLALFTVTQLVVYSAAQIPVGVLLDRYGARRLIATGALMMAVGQLGMAFAESIPVALGARVLIGASCPCCG